MPRWQDTPASLYRELEKQQRALAENAGSPAVRDIHLEFAERYREQAERQEVEEGRSP